LVQGADRHYFRVQATFCALDGLGIYVRDKAPCHTKHGFGFIFL